MSRTAAFPLRSARPDEKEALADLGHRAYRLGDEASNWLRYYRDHAHLAPEDTLVADEAGVIVGSAALLRLRMMLAGREVAMGGIAAVGVSPEHRRRGLGDQLMREALHRLRARGDGVSLLYAFRHSYYARFGYRLVETYDNLRARPTQLPQSPEVLRVRRLDLVRDEAAMRDVYDRARQSTTGPLARGDYWWRERLIGRVTDGAAHVGQDGAIDGYLVYKIGRPGPDLVVRELVATTPAAWRGLYGYLAAQGDQFRVVDLLLPRGEAVMLLEDYGMPEQAEMPPDRDYCGLLLGGAMARIVDLARAFAEHPTPARRGAVGAVTFGLDLVDPVFADQSGAFDVTVDDTGAHVARGQSARDRLTLGIDRLSQVYLGAARASDLLARGFVDGSAHAAELLDETFAGPTPWLGPGNAF